MSNQEQITVGFVGLGLMGAPMAANVLKAGYRLVVHDSRREAASPHLQAGAVWADTPRLLSSQVDVVMTCLPNLTAIEEVALGSDGLLSGIRRGAAYFDLSTSTPELVRRLHSAFAERDAHMLDAPISGGARGAQRGRLAIWVGGDKASYQRFEPVLKVMGDRPIHVGGSGTGVITKLVNNCVGQSIYAVLGEVFALGVKAGAEPLALWEAVRQGAHGRRRTYDCLIDEYLPAKYEPPNAALSIAYKDMLSVTELARELGVPMRVANIALADITEAMNLGWANRDLRSVMLLPQQRVGVTVKVDPKDIQEVLRRDPAAPSDTKFGIE